MLIAIDNLWNLTQLLSCLMVVASERSRLQTRSTFHFSLSLSHTLTHNMQLFTSSQSIHALKYIKVTVAFLFDPSRVSRLLMNSLFLCFLSLRTCTLLHSWEITFFCKLFIHLNCIFCLQLEMEEGDEIDAMLHQTGGTTAW